MTYVLSIYCPSNIIRYQVKMNELQLFSKLIKYKYIADIYLCYL